MPLGSVLEPPVSREQPLHTTSALPAAAGSDHLCSNASLENHAGLSAAGGGALATNAGAAMSIANHGARVAARSSASSSVASLLSLPSLWVQPLQTTSDRCDGSFAVACALSSATSSSSDAAERSVRSRSNAYKNRITFAVTTALAAKKTRRKRLRSGTGRRLRRAIRMARERSSCNGLRRFAALIRRMKECGKEK